MEIIRPDNPKYDRKRQLQNSRFDLKPAAIYYCESPDDVVQALGDASVEHLAVRVRSGGHHHEGMCSANDALMIDLSKIHHTDFGDEVVSLGPGAKLEAVYNTARAADQLFGGGGCGDVRVGGLVQGGGWGPYSRHLGMTCDRLVGVEIVTADGEIRQVTDSSDPDLMRAIRGGGGGNFGVVTDFRFAPAKRTGPVLTFGMTWSDTPFALVVAQEWLENIPGDSDHRLTTFCRFTAWDPEPEHGEPPVAVGGGFLGDRAELEETLRRLFPKSFEAAELKVFDTVAGLVPLHQPGPPLSALLRHHPDAVEEDLVNTCKGVPHRHKVSSSFPDPGFGFPSAQRAIEFLADGPPTKEGRYYLSLHSLGGAIASPDAPPSSFAFRDRPFMLQYQAWWVADPNLDRPSKNWIRAFREVMSEDTSFAFINFPDRDLAKDRHELLYQYYAGELESLIDVKARVDPEDVFCFDMGIPTS